MTAVQSDPPPRGPLGELTEGQPAHSGGHRLELRRRDDRRRATCPGRGERLLDDGGEQLGLLVELGVGGGDVALDLGPDRGEPRQDLVADPVAGVARVALLGSSTNGEAGLGRDRARLLTRDRVQGPDDVAVARLQPEQRPGAG